MPRRRHNNTRVIQRTTSETIRIGEPDFINLRPSNLPTNHAKKTVSSASFVVTGVSTRIDTVCESPDDSEEFSRQTDVETPSFSEDTSYSQYTEDIDYCACEEIILKTCVNAVLANHEDAVAQKTAEEQNASCPIKIITSSGKTNHIPSPGRFIGRFQVVKVESIHPFRRGRWICHDYVDNSEYAPKDGYEFYRGRFIRKRELEDIKKRDDEILYNPLLDEDQNLQSLTQPVTIVHTSMIKLPIGSATTWASPVLSKLSKYTDANPLGRPITTEELSWIGSLMLLGSVFGPPILNYSSAKIGRKKTMIWMCLPLLLSYLISAFASKIELFYLARFISGITVGSMAVCSIYMSEIVVKEWRGAAASVLKTSSALGGFYGYVIGTYLSVMSFSLVLLIPIIIYLPLSILVLPESPYYLISIDKEDEAKVVLKKLRGNNLDESEYTEIQEVVKQNLTSSFKELITNPTTRKALMITSALLILQQLTGINSVQVYAETLLSSTSTNLNPEIVPMIMGAVQLVGSLIAPLLADKLGRKILIIASATVICITSVALAFYLYFPSFYVYKYIPTTCLVLHVFAYAYGCGPIPWLILAEIMPRRVKDKGAAITASLSYASGFGLAKLFPVVSDSLGMYANFCFFAFCSLLMILFTIFFVPETKGKSPMELEVILRR